MKEQPGERLEGARRKHPRLGSSETGVMYGYFRIKRDNRFLHILSSGVDLESGWEHVSVTAEAINGRRPVMPSWDDMCLVKSLFWSDEETVVQFHPKQAKYINAHQHCLHLWKPTNVDYRLPPSILIA